MLYRLFMSIHHAQKDRVVEVGSCRVLGVFVMLLDFQGFLRKLERGIKLAPLAEVTAKIIESCRSQKHAALKVGHVIALRDEVCLFQELERGRELPRVQTLDTPNIAPDRVALNRSEEIWVRVTTTFPSQIYSLLVAFSRADEFLLSCVGTCFQLESFDAEHGLTVVLLLED
jgi:hypothetical protein